jgi:hypothetical protein
MSQLTYRVLVRGKFDRPDDETRVRLRSGLAEMQPLEFTEAGTFSYSASLASFTFRCVIFADSVGTSEQDVKDQAELMVMELLEGRGYPYRDLSAHATCLDHIKIRR